MDERDDSVETRVQRVPTINHVVTDAAPQPEFAASEAQPEVFMSEDATENPAVLKGSDETPHIQVETEEARNARLERQWKQLKVDVSELPDHYARLAKIKLTGSV